MDRVFIPATMLPAWNVDQAIKNKVAKNILLKTWGGLGDQVCAEPTLRHAFKIFKDSKISLASEQPILFEHLPFYEVFDLKRVQPVEKNYMVFDTIVDPSHLLWQFMSHCLTNAVDFSSICAFRMQLPVECKEINLRRQLRIEGDLFQDLSRSVVLHPGKHWPSKSIPEYWWNEVLDLLKSSDLVPIIIGKETDDNRSTVDVDTKGCIDLRNKTNLRELIWLLQNCKVLLTNDSSPLHIAASGKAHIGFIASCKYADYITHWRNGKWGWRMKNLGLDGIWNYIDHSPVQEKEVTVEFFPEGLTWDKILPPPEDVLEYVLSCLKMED